MANCVVVDDEFLLELCENFDQLQVKSCTTATGVPYLYLVDDGSVDCGSTDHMIFMFIATAHNDNV